MEMVSEVVGYDFDDSYPLVGRHELEVRLAQAVDGNEVPVEIDTSDERVQDSLSLLYAVFSRYQVVPSTADRRCGRSTGERDHAGAGGLRPRLLQRIRRGTAHPESGCLPGGMSTRNVGRRFREVRKRRDLTQREFARRAGVVGRVRRAGEEDGRAALPGRTLGAPADPGAHDQRLHLRRPVDAGRLDRLHVRR
ncbi:hypothetical protein [Actinomadura parmotrematis]|uniref:HTH cro/C1-type domain-containing protein n=1 Tax=Actinomadura parmotrematis TaxID=2864039 RepID=A0ABS7FXD1_9ACTN|nr:hypothetical protein [Actinomadura parmotrematis]MBW8485075.1 hypothetical protein [Actinomadura parmotrematis]